jgi:hypothetical protein
MLIKSIPASQGISRPQLFQTVEPNISGIVTMVSFQKQDSDKVYQRQNTLEMEIHQVFGGGKEERKFVDNEEGI